MYKAFARWFCMTDASYKEVVNVPTGKAGSKSRQPEPQTGLVAFSSAYRPAWPLPIVPFLDAKCVCCLVPQAVHPNLWLESPSSP